MLKITAKKTEEERKNVLKVKRLCDIEVWDD